jgi:Reverse transcriptase (RNA-dependent DNA polymerase)
MATRQQFTSLVNFRLAFQRLVRGQNREYRSFFRHLFPSYQIALERNLKNLIEEIRTGRYDPSAATCVFQPKKSGILRPLRLLALEDQIVYQAIINILANAFRHTQQAHAFRRVFGALVAAKNSPFFYRSWKRSHRKFESAIKTSFESGNSYVADFDLVSFYELIDHRLLRQLLERKVNSPKMLDLLFCCLEKWTESEWKTWLNHGIPQGPEPSAFLAECVLLDFDRLKFKNVVYLRYVDDIKLMAKDEGSVRRALLRLDISSKHLGLVPQAQKIECRQVKSVSELLKNLPSGLLSATSHFPTTSATQKRLERVFRQSIRKDAGAWTVVDQTKFKFSLARLRPKRSLLRRVEQILPHRPDLSWFFASYLKRFPCDREASEILLRVLRSDPIYDASAANYIDAMDVCEPSSETKEYRRVIHTAQTRSEEKSILLTIAAISSRGRREKPAKALTLIESQEDPLCRGILLHRLFGADPRAPFTTTAGKALMESETASPDGNLARYCADRLLELWPSESKWMKNKSAHATVKALLTSVGLRKRGPARAGVLDIFFKERNRIEIRIPWKTALGVDWRDAEGRCVRLQEFDIGDPSSWVLMLDTFNEVLLQNFSRKHPTTSAAFAKAAGSKAQPDIGNWLNNPALATALPKGHTWFKSVHDVRVTADLAHAKSKKGSRTKPVSYETRDKLRKGAKIAWAELLKEWKLIL